MSEARTVSCNTSVVEGFEGTCLGDPELSEGRGVVVLESFAGGVVTGGTRDAKRFLAALGSGRGMEQVA